jgi:hypothetical protein
MFYVPWYNLIGSTINCKIQYKTKLPCQFASISHLASKLQGSLFSDMTWINEGTKFSKSEIDTHDCKYCTTYLARAYLHT